MKTNTIIPVIREMHTSNLAVMTSHKMAVMRFHSVGEDTMNAITKIQLRRAQNMPFSREYFFSKE